MQTVTRQIDAHQHHAPSGDSGLTTHLAATATIDLTDHRAEAALAQKRLQDERRDLRRNPEPVLDLLGVLCWEDFDNSISISKDPTHDPRSAYVETFWLPVIGPSSTLLIRRLSEQLEEFPEGFELDCVSVSRDLGLGAKLTKRSPFIRTLERCERFGLIRIQGDVLYARRQIPSLWGRQIKRLTPRLQRLHKEWIDTASPNGEKHASQTVIRATQLARTLLALGDSPQQTEHQLLQWHFHPSIAFSALQWASDSSFNTISQAQKHIGETP